MKATSKRSLLVALALLAPAVVVAIWWAKSEHTPVAAKRVAQAFLERLEAEQFSQAFELTVKQGYVGQTPDELRAISSREFCPNSRFAYTFPLQSNGNRLRRLLYGREVDMPQVVVEYAGTCLLSVVVHKTAGNTWRVFRFARHAG